MKILFSGYHNPFFPTLTEYVEQAIKSLGFDLIPFEDRAFRFPHVGDQLMIDERLGHATIFRGPMPTDIWDYFAEQDADDFSLAGFQKFCK